MAAPDPALLVVDDNEDNRYTLVQRLRRHGYTNLTTATNGREALELLRARPFDLLLLDVTMPEMNGYEVLESLKADRALRHVPVIMISALDQMESVIRCIELGAEDYLPKPFNPLLLKARVGACLDKKRLRDELEAHVARMEADLEWARQIQMSMVPSEFPDPAEAPVGIFALLEPARHVGGDLYDFFHINPRTLCVVVADVSGKGPAAALFMARTKTLLRTLSSLLCGEGGAPPLPHEIVARMNLELCQDNPHSMFATAFLATIDLDSGDVRYCNAGHPFPYLVRAGEALALVGSRGKPIGILPSFAYVTAAARLEVRDCLFLFTDGITEALDADGTQFSPERLEKLLASMTETSAKSVVGTVVGAVRRFAGDEAQSDDIAALAVCRVASP